MIIGIFDGLNLITDTGKAFPVPSNYISKSKLVEGDGLKLIYDDYSGRPIFKQINSVTRRYLKGVMVTSNLVAANDRQYSINEASSSFYRLRQGDKVAIAIPFDNPEAAWATVINLVFTDDTDREM